MFDKLRQQSSDDVSSTGLEDEAPQPVRHRAVSRVPSGRMALPLTPPQRFVLALMLFLNVSVLGCFALFAFGKIWLPF